MSIQDSQCFDSYAQAVSHNVTKEERVYPSPSFYVISFKLYDLFIIVSLMKGDLKMKMNMLKRENEYNRYPCGQWNCWVTVNCDRAERLDDEGIYFAF